ncbi:MAG: hypothetical protein K0R29_1317 [Pseudobdellovibrio sp.]|nr:hypothetical protein [Pseudobdellovibrio sp.]
MSKLMKIVLTTLMLTFPVFAWSEVTYSFKGDFRFRNEQVKEEQVSPLPEADQFRQRLRARVGGTAKINEKSEITLRMATGSSSSSEGNTTNQTMTDYYSKKGFFLDLAYFNHKCSDETQIWGGKTPLVFAMAGGSDLVFDADLTPEGMALKYKHAMESSEVFANIGASWLAERFSATGATDNTDVGLIGGQVGFTQKFESYGFTLAVANYNFSNIKGATAPTAKGNTLVGGAYDKEYNLTVGDLEISTLVSDVPVALYYEMATNSEGGDYKTAGNVGVNIGKLKDPGSWLVKLDTREVEKDAVVGVLAESDSSGGGADLRSTRIAGFYQVAENTNVALTLFKGERFISSTTFTADYSRVQLDFNFMF